MDAMSFLTARKDGVGAPAPPLELPTAEGQPRSLSEFRGRPVVVSFLGPAHCLFCRAHLIKMIQNQDRIAELGDVLLVAYQDPELMMSKMMRDLAVPYVLLVDRTRESYARWGVSQYNWKAWLMPSLYPAILRLLLQRHPSLGSSPDRALLGGDFVVDRSGRLAFAQRMRGIHDRAPVSTLISALERA